MSDDNGTTDDPFGGPPGSDRAFDQLRATDPAAAAEVDLAGLRAAVDRRLQAPLPATSVPPSTGRPTRWLQVAAAAATIAVVGAAGFYLGAADRSTGSAATLPLVSTSSGSAAADGSGSSPELTAPLGLDSPAVGPSAGAPSSTPATAGGRDSMGAGQSTSSPSASGGKDSAFGGFGSRTVFTDGGLSTTGGSAEAFGYDPAAVVSRQQAESIAAALGLAGDAAPNYGSWTVGSTDGTGASLSLTGDGMASINFSDPSVDQSLVCPSSEEPSAGKGACAPPPGVVPITADQATAQMRTTLGALGLNPDAFQYEVSDQADTPYGWSTAYPLVNGQRTDQLWSFNFYGTTLTNFYGQLAPLVSLGQYQIVSAAEALQRLNDPRFGSSAVYPLDYRATDGGQSDTVPEPDSTIDPTVPPAPTAGAPIPWSVAEATITGATLGLSTQSQTDGSVVLVPTYTLTDADGVSWSVIAVADGSLAFGN